MKLTLRPLEPEDLEQLYEIENSMDDWEYSSANVPLSHYLLRDYIATQKCDLMLDRQVRLVICDETDKETIIGLADLTDYNPIHRRAEAGIIIAKAFRRQGYATESMRLLVDFAVKTRLLDQIFAYVSEDNMASMRLFEECGFSHTCTIKNWFRIGEKYVNSCFFQLFLKKV